ncbi:MAG: DUF2062 domain-containing protein [Holophagaceae bacterium]|nr:DUF2062 domain-containing protein [Holophagaceae bacterium]
MELRPGAFRGLQPDPGPAWPLVVTLCFLFKGLHRPLMLAASFINNPWTSVPIATGTAYFGNILMGRGLDLNMEAVHWGSIGLKSFTTREGAQAMFTMLKPILAPYLVGGFLLSLLAIPIGYLLAGHIAPRLRHPPRLAHVPPPCRPPARPKPDLPEPE